MNSNKYFINSLNSISFFLNKILRFIIAIMMTLMITSVLLDITLRYFGRSFSFGDELARFMLIGIVFIGAGICVHEKQHVKLSILTDRFSGKFKILFSILSLVIIILVMFFFINSAWLFAKSAPTHRSSVMGISMFWPKLLLLVSGIIMVFYYIVEIIRYIYEYFAYN